VHHSLGLAFVTYQVKQTCAQTGYNACQAGDDDNFDNDRAHGTLAIELKL
jgi:hypothetical protein